MIGNALYVKQICCCIDDRYSSICYYVQRWGQTLSIDLQCTKAGVKAERTQICACTQVDVRMNQRAHAPSGRPLAFDLYVFWMLL